jgi:hypothetical protein
MLQSIGSCGRQLNEDDIFQFEKMLENQLPMDYVGFLLKYNGGEPKPDCHGVQSTEGTNIGQIIGVRWFFSIDGPDGESDYIKKCYDIVENLNDFEGRIPNNFLPIACDDGGNQICLSLYGKDKGSVWYWDHEAEHYPSTYSNCYKVADSFQDLLDGMFEYDFENDVRVSQ